MVLIVGAIVGFIILSAVLVVSSSMLSSQISGTESDTEEWRALQARAEMRRIRAREDSEQGLPGTTTHISSSI